MPVRVLLGDIRIWVGGFSDTWHCPSRCVWSSLNHWGPERKTWGRERLPLLLSACMLELAGPERKTWGRERLPLLLSACMLELARQSSALELGFIPLTPPILWPSDSNWNYTSAFHNQLADSRLWKFSASIIKWHSSSESLSLGIETSVSSITQSCLTLCEPMDCSTPGFPVHHQLPELTQTHVHHVGDAIQPSHPLSSPSHAFNRPQHQGLF